MNHNTAIYSIQPFQTRQMASIGQEESVFLVSLKRVCILALAFAYVTLPMWGTWLASYYQLHTVSSRDLLLAICWLPASAAIIHLSFTKTRLHPAIALAVFTALNTLVFLAVWYFNLWG